MIAKGLAPEKGLKVFAIMKTGFRVGAHVARVRAVRRRTGHAAARHDFTRL
jgi:hypothetical protein